jgi:hypothetical protein
MPLLEIALIGVRPKMRKHIRDWSKAERKDRISADIHSAVPVGRRNNTAGAEPLPYRIKARQEEAGDRGRPYNNFLDGQKASAAQNCSLLTVLC